jgi:hypothetical protein
MQTGLCHTKHVGDRSSFDWEASFSSDTCRKIGFFAWALGESLFEDLLGMSIERRNQHIPVLAPDQFDRDLGSTEERQFSPRQSKADREQQRLPNG